MIGVIFYGVFHVDLFLFRYFAGMQIRQLENTGNIFKTQKLLAISPSSI